MIPGISENGPKNRSAYGRQNFSRIDGLLRILPPCQDSFVGHFLDVAIDCLVVNADILHFTTLGVIGLKG